MDDITLPRNNKIALALCTLGLGLAATEAQTMTLSIDAGSAWYCECSPGFFLPTAMTSGPDGGIIIGQAQPATGSHSNPVDGSESPGIDQPWTFFGNTGMHLTNAPVEILSHSGNTMTLDFSGWGFTWNTHEFVPLNSGAWWPLGGSDGVAEVTCGEDCSVGDSYQLHYTATIPADTPTGFNNVRYRLELQGTISAIPIPAAGWLFGSGLLGLLGAGRLKTNHATTP